MDERMTNAAGAVGLVLAQPERLLGIEPFWMELIAGIEETLVQRDLSILVHVVPAHDAEVEIYRRWADWRLVDAVVVVNLVQDDQRPAVLRELGLPCLLVGTWGAPGFTTIRSDGAGVERAALAHLLGLGHR